MAEFFYIMKLKSIAQLTAILAALFAAALLLARCERESHSLWRSLKDPGTVQQLKQFVALNKAMAEASTNAMPSEIKTLFNYAKRGDWLAFSNSWAELAERMDPDSPPRGRVWAALGDFLSPIEDKLGWHLRSTTQELHLQGTPWMAIREVRVALEAFGEGNEKYTSAFVRDVAASIPRGSIYFAGSDPGPFAVTAICSSQVKGAPFFVLSQNALRDSTYIDYLRQLYGTNIYLPEPADLQRCFEQYTKALQTWFRLNPLKPGENVHEHEDGEPEFSVMAINGRVVKTIFDKNPDRSIFIAESEPIGWMYPQLEPHGLIFKLNRQPAAILPGEIVERDHEYWTKHVQPMIGGWLNDKTSIAEIATFAEKTYGRSDFSGFTGDPRFVQNVYSQKMFSKLRSSIAGLYEWRAAHAANAEDRERMAREADFAFRQAWALCPDSLETVYRYANFLITQNRIEDATLIAETASILPQYKGSDQWTPLLSTLKKMRK